jgi:hypothetical protein
VKEQRADLIHREGQSTMWAHGDTGLRYRQHRDGGSSVMLFARLLADL